MGLINNDLYTASNGVQKSGTYISFTNEVLYLKKKEGFVTPATNVPNAVAKPYTAYANYRIYWDETSRTTNKGFIDLKNITVDLEESELNDSLYTILYAKLKLTYPNTTNA